MRQHVDHRERGLGRPAAVVLLRLGQARAVEALLLVVEGEHAEADRLAGVERDAGEAVGRGGGDVLEVRGAAAHDHAEGDHRIRPGSSATLRGDGQLEAAGHLHERDVGARRVEHRAARPRAGPR